MRSFWQVLKDLLTCVWLLRLRNIEVPPIYFVLIIGSFVILTSLGCKNEGFVFIEIFKAFGSFKALFV